RSRRPGTWRRWRPARAPPAASPERRRRERWPWHRRRRRPPPPSLPTPPSAECGVRNAEYSIGPAESMGGRQTPHSAFRIPHSFPGSSVVAPVHHPARAPFGRSLEAPLLVRRLGHDRRNRGRPAVVVERDVGHVARVGMPALARG